MMTSELIEELKPYYHQEVQLKNRALKKIRLLSLIPVEEYEEAVISIPKEFLADLVKENEKLKVEINEIQAQIENFNNVIKEKEQRKKEKDNLKKSQKKDRKKIKSEFFPNAPIDVDSTKELINCHSYNEYNDDGTPKIIRKKDIYQHNFLTIFRKIVHSAKYPIQSDENTFILSWKLCKFEGLLTTTISGPGDSSSDDLTYGGYASCFAISLYPHVSRRPHREGDPICDRFTLSLYKNRIIACLTDGCNWGDKPRKASRIANKIITQYIKDNFDKIKDIQSSIFTILAAIADAQISIIDGDDDEWRTGTTTASCGLLLEIDQEHVEDTLLLEDEPKIRTSLTPSKWIFVSVNVGDCKIIHISLKDNLTATDITDCLRSNTTDMTDPGGRLGAFKDGWPDLRNLSVNFQPVDEGDLILIMSDGVHDNLDPQILGCSLSEFGLEDKSWESAPPFLVAEIKRLFFLKSIEVLFSGDELISPKIVKDKLLAHCFDTTLKSRNFLEENPSMRAPADYRQYPGKLDHSSLICFRVGKTNRLNKETDTSEVNLLAKNQRKKMITHNISMKKSTEEKCSMNQNTIINNSELIDYVKTQISSLLSNNGYNHFSSNEGRFRSRSGDSETTQSSPSSSSPIPNFKPALRTPSNPMTRSVSWLMGKKPLDE